MSDEITVRVVGRRFSAGGELYDTDDELTVLESVAERHPNTLKPVDEDEDDRAATLAEADYEVAVEAVHAGEADEFLDELDERDERTSVSEAIEERRAELETENEG